MAGVGREKDYGPGPARCNPHDPGQVFVKAAHLQPVQVDKRRLGTKLSPLGDETVDGQISYTRKIRIGVGMCGQRSRASPTSTSQTLYAENKRARTAND